jgi:release factor glutamine methyltransferase
MRSNLTFLHEGVKRLGHVHPEGAWREMKEIFRFATEKSFLDVVTGDMPLSIKERSFIRECVLKRSLDIPLAYVLQKAHFLDFILGCRKGVFIPRPETEILVREAVAACSSLDNPLVMDLGTGTGNIAIGICKMLPQARLKAFEISSDAFECAQENIKEFGLSEQIELIYADYLLDDIDFGKADLIVSNPPYVAQADLDQLSAEVGKEPVLALDGGPDGDEILKQIIDKMSMHMKTGARLMMEIGIDQDDEIRGYVENFSNLRLKGFTKDMNGINRIVTLTKF